VFLSAGDKNRVGKPLSHPAQIGKDERPGSPEGG